MSGNGAVEAPCRCGFFGGIHSYFARLAVTRLSIFHFHFYSLFLDRPADKCYNKIISNFKSKKVEKVYANLCPRKFIGQRKNC